MNVLKINSQVPPIQRSDNSKQTWSELLEWKKELETLNIDTKEIVLFVDKDLYSWFWRALLTYGISKEQDSNNMLSWIKDLEYLGIGVWENENNNIAMRLHIYTPFILSQ